MTYFGLCATRGGSEIRRAFGNRVELANLLGQLLGERPAGGLPMRCLAITESSPNRSKPVQTGPNQSKPHQTALHASESCFRVIPNGFVAKYVRETAEKTSQSAKIAKKKPKIQT